MHVDDVSQEATGPSAKAMAGSLGRAARDLREGLEVHLKAKLASDKTALAVSSSEAEQWVRNDLGELAGKAKAKSELKKEKSKDAVRHLGVDFTAGSGKRRHTQLGPTRAKRVKIALKRVPRILRLAKQAAKARAIFRTGLMPSLTFGGEVTGTSDALCRQWRAMATRIAGHPNASKDVWGPCMSTRTL